MPYINPVRGEIRDPERIDTVVDALRAAWKANPDLRFGQLVHNAFSRIRPMRDWLGSDEVSDIRALEDERWLECFTP